MSYLKEQSQQKTHFDESSEKSEADLNSQIDLSQRQLDSSLLKSMFNNSEGLPESYSEIWKDPIFSKLADFHNFNPQCPLCPLGDTEKDSFKDKTVCKFCGYLFCMDHCCSSRITKFTFQNPERICEICDQKYFYLDIYNRYMKLKAEKENKMKKLRKSITDLRRSNVRESDITFSNTNSKPSPTEDYLFPRKNTENEINCQIKVYEEEINTLSSCVMFYEQAIRNRNFSVFSGTDNRKSTLFLRLSDKIKEVSMENYVSEIASKRTSQFSHKEEKNCLSCSIY